jgi:hypothetical protein
MGCSLITSPSRAACCCAWSAAWLDAGCRRLCVVDCIADGLLHAFAHSAGGSPGAVAHAGMFLCEELTGLTASVPTAQSCLGGGRSKTSVSSSQAKGRRLRGQIIAIKHPEKSGRL